MLPPPPPRRPLLAPALAALCGVALGPFLPEGPFLAVGFLAPASLWLPPAARRLRLAALLLATFGLYAGASARAVAVPPPLPAGPLLLRGRLAGDLEGGGPLLLRLPGGRRRSLRLPRHAAVHGAPASGAAVEVVGRGAGTSLRVAELRQRSPAPLFARSCAALRRWVRARVAEAPEPASGLLRAGLLGERVGLAQPVRAAFARTGCAHLLSMSGLHTGFLLAGALGLCGLFRPRPAALRAAGLLAAGLLLALAVVRPPVLRAGVAAAVVLLLPGRGDGFNRLAAACLVVLAWDPSAGRDVGFQLSFGTVAGILALLPALRRGLRGRGPMWASFAYPTVCSLVSLPLVGLTLGSLPFASLILGVPAVLLFSAGLGLGAVGVGLGSLSTAAGAWVLALAALPLRLLVALVHAAAALPLVCPSVDRPSVELGVLGCGLLALGAIRRERGRGGAALFACGVAALAAALVVPGGWARAQAL
ncbi:MAG: ComEC/Rec2 family competence protein [Planctomycetota bacterium]|nr:MAG: ComEC/Rec2 family competence protein [Planctomycetota bacterium]